MDDVVIWRDQTLSEAARLRIPPVQLGQLADKLSQLPFAGCDMWLDDGLYYKQESHRFSHWRSRIHPQIRQVEAASSAGFTRIIVVYNHKPGELANENLEKVLRAGSRLNLRMSLEIGNAADLSLQELADIFTSLAAFDVQSFIYCDSDSKLDPFITSAIFSNLLQSALRPLEIHAHNAYGLATANCLAAVGAGVRCVHTAIAGIGPCGHAAYEEVVMAVKHLGGLPFGDLQHLAEDCYQALGCIGVKPPLAKAVIGSDIFAHESGIHVAGILKEPDLYEAFSPEEVGLSRRLVIGKHSGRASLEAKFSRLNLALAATESQLLLAQARQLAVDQKSALTDGQLKQLYHNCVIRQGKGC